jgi:hypothetical protein
VCFALAVQAEDLVGRREVQRVHGGGRFAATGDVLIRDRAPVPEAHDQFADVLHQSRGSGTELHVPGSTNACVGVEQAGEKGTALALGGSQVDRRDVLVVEEISRP